MSDTLSLFDRVVTTDFAPIFNSLESGDYFAERGIGWDVERRLCLKTHEDGLNHFIKHGGLYEEASEWRKAYRYFIPCIEPDGSIEYFLTRGCEEYAKEHGITLNHKIHNLKHRPIKFVNQRYITHPPGEIIFLCEGVFDALSFEELGYPAISINSTSNSSKLIDLIIQNKQKHKDTIFSIAFDHDKAGKEAQENILNELNQAGLHAEPFLYPEYYKDINDCLLDNRPFLEDLVYLFIETIGAPDAVSRSLSIFVDQLDKQTPPEPISTGFRRIDEALGGGLSPGLYVLGAISSLGKTTLALQMANNIANTGQDVLFFSLEMSKMEMIAKSISSMTGGIAREKKASVGATVRDVMRGDIDFGTFCRVLEDYKKSGKHLSVVEGNFDTTVMSIWERVRKHIARRMKPVVFVDYLQIITPASERTSDKQNIDRAVTTMKRMSREFDIPVILISSLNRDGYTTPVSYTSFKESGCIEYSADVIMGLNLQEVHEIQSIKKITEKQSRLDAAKRKLPRDVELVILKNRNGSPWVSIPFQYFARFNYFEEISLVKPPSPF
jgi:replicative DNA helicase